MLNVEQIHLNVIDSVVSDIGPSININKQNEIRAPFTKSRLIFGALSNGREVVLKYSALRNGATREWEGLKQLYPHHLHVQQPLALATSNSGEKVLITFKTEGEPLYNYGNPSLRYDVGFITREIHDSVKINRNEWAKSGKQDFSYYDRLIRYWNKGIIDVLKSDTPISGILKNLIQNTQVQIESQQPRFIHYDIYDAQVIVSNTGMTLIDFENWEEADGLEDVAKYLFHIIREQKPIEFFSHFAKGYFEGEGISEIQKKLVAFYLVFLSCRAVSYFYNFSPSYLEESKINLGRVSKFMEDEGLWKAI